jgi:hypothetical protein
MAKDRSDRPQTAGELIDELRASLGLPARGRARVIHSTDTGQLHATDAGLARGTQGQAQVSEAATAHLSPETSAEVLQHSHANTVLTSEFESPSAGPGRETTAQHGRPVTSGNVRAQQEAGRETVVERAAETQAGVTADSHRVAQQPPVAETRSAFQQGASQQGADLSQQGAGISITAPEPRRSFAPLVAGGALALLLVLGVGGWFVWSRMRPKPDVPVVNTPPTVNTSTPLKPAEATKAEAANYWFESFDKNDDPSGKRIADTAATLQSGKWFKFHFTPKERGYLYIIGPGAGGNAQMTMLTAQGAGTLKSNLVGAGADFAFPFGAAKFKLDDNPGADDFTFIFSPSPLMSPSFLTGEYKHNLTPAEVKELEDFRAQFKAGAPSVESKGDGDSRSVVVSAPQSATTGSNPLIFDVRVNHR